MNVLMQMPEQVQVEYDSPVRARFIMQPLEEGYGVTIGNSLRRVLLSTTPGSAIVGVHIGGVQHEFQTIPNVVEDMCEIILNLKEVRLTLLDKKTTKLNFTLKGPYSWTARDLEENAPGLIGVLNPGHHIATLSKGAELNIQLRFGSGKGYIPAEDQSTSDYPVGMIPIDAIYTPIKNVIYSIEPFRVGQKTDYEKLTLTVTTDGTISPQEAVQDAADIIRQHIDLFINFTEMKGRAEDPQPSGIDEAKEAERKRIRTMLLMPVEELELSVRAHNCLKAANIKTLGELVQLHEPELLKFRNFGRKSLSELADVVRNHNLQFGMNVEKYIKDEPKQVSVE